MFKFIEKFKSDDVKTIVNSAGFKVATMTGTCLVALAPVVAHADPTAPDMSSIVGSMTTSFGSVTSVCLSAVAAIAPVGITIFGAMFVWKKGIALFKKITQ